jgi:peptidoglycan/LPS O-acetylase OafA/YrhL
MMSNVTFKMSRINGVTGLRGLAVIAVIAFHYWEHLFPMGYLGVDVFFVISGYCICAAFYKKRFHEDWTKKFLINRIYRLIPTSSVVIFLTLVIGYVFFQKHISHSISAEGLSALLIVSNYYYFFTTDYFGSESITKPLLHMWSLATEWQCYVLFFLATFFLKKRRYLYIYIALLSLILFFSKKIAYSFAHIDIDYEGAYGLEYYWLTPHLLEFSAGAIAFLICTRIEKNLLPKKLLKIILIILIFTLLAIIFGRHFEYATAISVVTGITFGIIILLGIGTQTIFLGNSLITSIGTISYSLYLTHWPLLSFAFLTNKYYGAYIDFGNDLHKILILLTVVIISILMYICIERPLRYKPITKSRNIIYTFFYLSLILFAYCFFLLTKINVSVDLPIVSGGLSIENESKLPPQTVNHVAAPEAILNSVKPSNLTEDVLYQYHKKFYGGSLDWVSNNSSAPVIFSHSANSNGSRNLVLFGDSHARQYAYGFYSDKNLYKKIVYVRPEKIMKCQPNEIKTINNYLGDEPKDIYFAARWDYFQHFLYDLPSANKVTIPDIDELANFYTSQLKECLKFLEISPQDNIFVIGSVPELSNFKATFECQQSSKLLSTCEPEVFKDKPQMLYRHNFNTNFKKLLYASHLGIKFVDPFDILCDKKSGICHSFYNGNLLYSDQNHLSLIGSVFFINKLSR